MAIKLGSSGISKLYLGSTEATKAYLGSVEVYSAVVANPFTFSVNTANAGTLSTQFQLPLVSSGAISMDVDWGDGTTDTITAYNQAETLHTYSTSGTYTISITNEVRGFKFANGGDKKKILDISNWGEFNFDSNQGFNGCTSLTCSATDIPTISAPDWSWTFGSCPNFNGVVAGWDVSGVVNMYTLFYSATSFNQDLSSWDINQVTNFSYILFNTGLSTANYDSILVSWEAQAPQLNQIPQFGNAKYTLGSAAATARASLINTYGWTITDGGGI